MKTWGDVYNAALRRGEDHGYAAHLADEWDKRMNKQAIKEAMPIGCLAFLPRVVKVAREHGYALTVHGSMARDFDFVAIPWTEEATPAEELVAAIIKACGTIFRQGEEDATPKPHGRRAWQLHLCGGPYIDLSVMPRA